MKLPQNFLDKADKLLDLKHYSTISEPIYIGTKDFEIPYERQYILRMLINAPGFGGPVIPKELNWLRETIFELIRIQDENALYNPYIYVTVRHGFVTSETDDEWHVDGFSKRIPHQPEQDYIWSNCHPTEYLDQSFDIPEDFDPLKHNLHYFLQGNADESKIKTCEERRIYLFDPYFVHRRKPNLQNMIRSFWRISFLPIEIQDNGCTKNPLLEEKIYDHVDIRTKLTRYEPSN